MKVDLPSACLFLTFSPLTAESHLCLCLSEQLPKQQLTLPEPSSAPAVTMRSKCEFTPPPSRFFYSVDEFIQSFHVTNVE